MYPKAEENLSAYRKMTDFPVKQSSDEPIFLNFSVLSGTGFSKHLT